MPMPMPES